MLVRCARDGDEGPASDLVRRSVTELCATDHRGDAQVLARWLATGTPEDFRRWTGATDRSVCVAVRDDGRPEFAVRGHISTCEVASAP